MDDNYNLALMLLIVGMITVFLILALVVISGNLLIRFINRFFPAAINEHGAATAEISSKKIAVIIAVIDMITGGKGKISKIAKPDKE